MQQAGFRRCLQNSVVVQQGAYQSCCGCGRVRAYRPKKNAKRTAGGKLPRVLDARNAKCGVHGKKKVDKGILTAHDEVLKLASGATVLSQVPFKSEGHVGRDFNTKQWTSEPDIKLDLLVQSQSGVFCAIEISGREHKYGKGPDRDDKKEQFFKKWQVPLLTLPLTSQRTVPLAEWRQQLLDAQSLGWIAG